jgi:hypothetical protein
MTLADERLAALEQVLVDLRRKRRRAMVRWAWLAGFACLLIVTQMATLWMVHGATAFYVLLLGINAWTLASIIVEARHLRRCYTAHEAELLALRERLVKFCSSELDTAA